MGEDRPRAGASSQRPTVTKVVGQTSGKRVNPKNKGRRLLAPQTASVKGTAALHVREAKGRGGQAPGWTTAGEHEDQTRQSQRHQRAQEWFAGLSWGPLCRMPHARVAERSPAAQPSGSWHGLPLAPAVL